MISFNNQAYWGIHQTITIFILTNFAVYDLRQQQCITIIDTQARILMAPILIICK